MIPIRDANPSLSTPVVTWLIILVASAVFFVIEPRSPNATNEFVYRYAAIPCELTTGMPLDQGDTAACSRDPVPPPFFPGKDVALSVLVSMFLHANLGHLLGNMWSLWIFGNNVEDAYGKLGYLLLYLASGVVATGAFVLANPASLTPLVGASGAIAGIMGAYLVLYPDAQVVTIVPIFFFLPFVLPASLFLILWFVGQFFIGDSGVAWQAHVGGFVFGAAVTALLRPFLLARLRRRRQALGYV